MDQSYSTRQLRPPWVPQEAAPQLRQTARMTKAWRPEQAHMKLSAKLQSLSHTTELLQKAMYGVGGVGLRSHQLSLRELVVLGARWQRQAHEPCAGSKASFQLLLGRPGGWHRDWSLEQQLVEDATG